MGQYFKGPRGNHHLEAQTSWSAAAHPRGDGVSNLSLAMLKGIGQRRWLFISILEGPLFRSTISQETPWKVTESVVCKMHYIQCPVYISKLLNIKTGKSQ